MKKKERIAAALEVARRYGGVEGAHHKDWVIDQMVRYLTGDKYEEFVAAARSGAEGLESFEWAEGIAP
jgi:hypothetical protein